MTLFRNPYRDKRTGRNKIAAIWNLETRIGDKRHTVSLGTTDRAEAERRALTLEAERQKDAGTGDFTPEDSRKVLIGSEAFLYKQKAPFVASGRSVKGALEWDEAEDRVKCHECGDWFKFLGTHIPRAHGMNARDYKQKHGLALGSALVCEGIRNVVVQAGCKGADAPEGSVRRSANGELFAERSRRGDFVRRGPRPLNMELRNKRATCPAQLLERIRTLGEKLGRSPSTADLLEIGVHARSVTALFGQSLPEVRRLAGLNFPEPKEGRPSLSSAVLVEMLRDFYVRFHRIPSSSDFRRGLLPTRGTYATRFGGWEAALFAAGLEKVPRPGRGRPKAVRT